MQVSRALVGAKIEPARVIEIFQVKVEHRVLVSASPETIYSIYEDVANWRTWDPATKSSSLDGPFIAGSKGKLTPAKGNTVPMTLIEANAGRNFTVECKIPLFRMTFEHELSCVGKECEVIHRAAFSGLLAPLLGRVIGAQINRGLPDTLQRLKNLAEAKEESAV
ncbi:MAG: SRPBCC family protein [Nitrospiraceae bacterium]